MNLQFDYKNPMEDIQKALDEKDKVKVLELHKSLLCKTGMFGYYYGSGLYNEVKEFINEL